MAQPNRRVAVMQSNYIPWKGYFDILQRVDTFVFYDDVQYTKNDWRNRNRIKTSAGLKWLTVPTGADLNRRICDVEIVDAHWQQKHFRTLIQAYSKAPCLGEFRPWLDKLYCQHAWLRLSELNQFIVKEIATRFLGYRVDFRSSAEFALSGSRSQRLLDLLRQLETSVYVSGPSAKAYIPERQFEAAGIDVQYMDYSRYPEYPQLFPPFVHEVSILDLLFNVGSDARRYIPRP
jgi:hypothetical protein